MNAVMSLRPTPVQYKCSGAGLSLHTVTLLLTTDLIQHKQSRHTQRASEELSKMLLAGNHWVSPPPPLPVSVCCVLHPSNFIYLLCSPPSLWNGQCALRLRHFSNLSLSMPCTYTAPLSLPFFAFFFSLRVSGGRSRSQTDLHLGAESDLVTAMRVDLLYLWFLFSDGLSVLLLSLLLCLDMNIFFCLSPDLPS